MIVRITTIDNQTFNLGENWQIRQIHPQNLLELEKIEHGIDVMTLDYKLQGTSRTFTMYIPNEHITSILRENIKL